MIRKIIRLGILAGAAVALCSANLGPTLTLLPGSGDISGTPGSTIGWGYTISNPTSFYLLTFGFSSNAFPAGAGTALMPNSIFDFPELAPGQTITEEYSTHTLSGACPSLPCGLLQITIPGTTLPEVVSGAFTVNAEYFNDANFDIDEGPSPDLTANYSVSVIPLATPEPGLYGMLTLGMSALCLAGVRRKRLG